MAKQDRKTGKIEVPEAGKGPALKHNPFGGLGGIDAPGSTAVGSKIDAPVPVLESPQAEKKSRGRLILRREKKQRGGKTVVIVAGLRASAHLPESEIAKLLQDLKQQLGCGGTVERVPNDTELVIQGDQPARVAELLRARNFRVDGVTA